MANWRIKGGSTATASAAKQTAGVYTRANFDMKFSDFDFRDDACSSKSRIFDAVDSPNALVV